eukprot:scaffold9775_cov90-Isochrysis_galbana.AAC.3
MDVCIVYSASARMERNRRTPSALGVNVKCGPLMILDSPCCTQMAMVPLVITSLGAREDVNAAIHSYGGLVFHDVINNKFAHKAIQKGADGLVAVAAGAGGHAGTLSPFALVSEIREWFDGPIALSGAISTGRSILAAQAMGADFAYLGSAFIPTTEANAADAYKQAIVDCSAEDIVYSSLFTGGWSRLLQY